MKGRNEIKTKIEITPKPGACASVVSAILVKAPSLALGIHFFSALGCFWIKSTRSLFDLQWACYTLWGQGKASSFRLLLLLFSAAWEFLRDGIIVRRCGRWGRTPIVTEEVGWFGFKAPLLFFFLYIFSHCFESKHRKCLHRIAVHIAKEYPLTHYRFWPQHRAVLDLWPLRLQ
jgi:hypothetical protein